MQKLFKGLKYYTLIYYKHCVFNVWNKIDIKRDYVSSSLLVNYFKLVKNNKIIIFKTKFKLNGIDYY